MCDGFFARFHLSVVLAAALRRSKQGAGKYFLEIGVGILFLEAGAGRKAELAKCVGQVGCRTLEDVFVIHGCGGFGRAKSGDDGDELVNGHGFILALGCR